MIKHMIMAYLLPANPSKSKKITSQVENIQSLKKK